MAHPQGFYYYGVSAIPYAVVSGDRIFSFPGGLNAATYFSAMKDSVDVRSLYDPKVGIEFLQK
jgi:hypothetical protein